MGGLGRQPAWEPEWECAHGRQPFDNTPPCGCWSAENRVIGCGNRYPAGVKREAAAMYAGGASMRAVASRFGVSSRTVRLWCAAYGVGMRPPGNPNWRRAA